jgi:phosphoserine aminotransferase
MMTRVYNFGAGPATIAEPVLQQAQEELLNWRQTGMSVMEVSHRSKEFKEVLQQATQDLRELMQINDDYEVIFLTSPARAQFAMVPLNILGNHQTASYIHTGVWSDMAIEEARKFCQVNVVASNQEDIYRIPARETWDMAAQSAYFYFTSNETISGVEFQDTPDVGDIPLVADMTSNILSRPVDVSRYGIIFAGAQKNIGPAGLTLVIIRKDLLERAGADTPAVMDYQLNANNASVYYTPATFCYYMAGLTFRWLKQQGGLAVIAERNQRKSTKLYNFIDQSDFYQNPVALECRSWMNIPFILQDDQLDSVFLEQAKQQGLAALKGHRLVGGMRASMYNAMPEAGVDALIDFMRDFARRYG